MPALALLFVGACTSVEQKLEGYLRQFRYTEALALLEDEGVGEVPSVNADPEALALRVRYTEHIETATKEHVGELIRIGRAHDAQALARERADLCPWSVRLAELLASTDQMVGRIESLENKWSTAFTRESVAATDARQFLSEIAPDRPWILDSDHLRRFELLAIRSIVQDWASLLDQRDGRPTQAERGALFEELRRCGFTEAELAVLQKVLDILARLPVDPRDETRLDAAGLEALAAARELLASGSSPGDGTRIAPCLEAAWNAFTRWHHTSFTRMLVSPQVSYPELELAETWESIETYRDAQRLALARAHAHRATRRARQGLAAALALLHARRARTLGLPEHDPELAEAERLAQATLTATPTPAIELQVTLEPKVDPEIRSLVETAIIHGLQSPAGALSRLKIVSTQRVTSPPKVSVLDAELVADFDGLRSVWSSYFSHFETVVNPAKRALKTQLDLAEWDVDSKKRAYNWAVSSYNIWPTEYSLNNVNSAYTAYVRAVDYYNELVALYNATPATTTRPVYLPYSFLEGNVRFGWKISYRVEVPGVEPIAAVRESVVTDFVRIGSKATDKVEAYRRQDDLDVDISPIAGLGHLLKVISLLREEMNLALASLPEVRLADLTPAERAILGWLFHPWGIQPSLAERLCVPRWAVDAARGLELRRPARDPPALVLRPPRTPVSGPLDPESASTALAQFVGRIFAVDNREISFGTATLIGENGLLLTCAHVLVASSFRVEFTTGPYKGIYDCDLVFVNSERDVALLRARGLRNDAWAVVRLTEESRQGEDIVAIGNPAMDIGGFNLGGMSRGIVSNPCIQRGNSIYLAADVSIASGSSGGPLFSLKDGALIGVVQMVATFPGIPRADKGVAATGYLCLAAPASMLGAWLGLR